MGVSATHSSLAIREIIHDGPATIRMPGSSVPHRHHITILINGPHSHSEIPVHFSVKITDRLVYSGGDLMLWGAFEI